MRSLCLWTLRTGGFLVFLCGFPHALLGWPQFTEALAQSQMAPNVVRGLSIGWHFGSASMVALGLVVLAASRELERGTWSAHWTAAIPGLAFAGFGVWALAYSSGNPHFVGFVVIGAPVARAALAFPASAGR